MYEVKHAWQGARFVICGGPPRSFAIMCCGRMRRSSSAAACDQVRCHSLGCNKIKMQYRAPLLSAKAQAMRDMGLDRPVSADNFLPDKTRSAFCQPCHDRGISLPIGQPFCNGRLSNQNFGLHDRQHGGCGASVCRLDAALCVARLVSVLPQPSGARSPAACGPAIFLRTLA